eukprot:gene27323-biopygen8674
MRKVFATGIKLELPIPHGAPHRQLRFQLVPGREYPPCDMERHYIFPRSHNMVEISYFGHENWQTLRKGRKNKGQKMPMKLRFESFECPLLIRILPTNDSAICGDVEQVRGAVQYHQLSSDSDCSSVWR